MTYTAEISRRSPTAFVILVDQSGSMSEPFGLDAKVTKAHFVADVVNRWVQNLVLRCAKGETIRDYFHLGLIGYGGQERSLLKVGGGGLVPMSTVAISHLRIEDRRQKVDDGAGGIVEVNVKFPTWVEPTAAEDTPMTAALMRAHDLLEAWTQLAASSFPPIVVNITDGQATDGDPRPASRDLTALATDDGNVLLFNCHISGYGGRPYLFPDSVNELPDPFAEVLFEMSSELPLVLRDAAVSEGYTLTPQSRGFAYQADAARLVSFLDIGTRLTALLGTGR